MPVALTEEEKTLRQLALMNELTKQNKPIPKAFMGLDLSNIPNLDQRVQDAIAANQTNTVPSLETTTTPTTVDLGESGVTTPADLTSADTSSRFVQGLIRVYAIVKSDLDRSGVSATGGNEDLGG